MRKNNIRKWFTLWFLWVRRIHRILAHLTNGFGRKRYASIIRLRYASYSLSSASGTVLDAKPKPWLLSRCGALLENWQNWYHFYCASSCRFCAKEPNNGSFIWVINLIVYRQISVKLFEFAYTYLLTGLTIPLPSRPKPWPSVQPSFCNNWKPLVEDIKILLTVVSLFMGNARRTQCREMAIQFPWA